MTRYVRSRLEQGHRHYFAWPEDLPPIEGDEATPEHTHEDLASLEHAHDYADPDHLHPHSHPENAGAVHTHSYADVDHTHPGGAAHPDLATHEALGLASDTHTHDTTHSHTAGEVGAAATVHSHAYADPSHDHDADYSGTGHTHDTTHDHAGAYSPLGHDHAGDYSPLGHGHDTSHSHTAAEVGAAGESHTHDLTAYATDQDLADHAASPHGGESTEAFPVGSLFLSTVNTDPATLLGYGTWQAFGDGRLLMSDTTAKQTGGSSTHTHADHTGVINHTHPVTDPGHSHVETSNNATTGPNRGWGAADTSTNTETATGYSTASATTGVTVANPSGGVASLTHDSPSHLPPYITVRVWERTA